MWERPYAVTDAVAELIWEAALRSRSIVQLSGDTTPLQDDTRALVFEWFTTAMELLRGNEQVGSWVKTVTLEEFKRVLGPYMVREAKKIADQRSYPAFAQLAWSMLLAYRLQRHLGTELAESVADICNWIASGVHLLVGTPTELLVGTHGGVPAWKTIDRIRPHEAQWAVRTTLTMLAGVIQSIGPHDTWLVPDFRAYDRDAILASMGGDYLDSNKALIESALHNQRYIIHPGGVLVKVTGAGHVTGLRLKVRPAANALVDILAFVETARGGYFTVMSEEQLLGIATTVVPFPCLGGKDAAVICQVYHDLVTAQEVQRPGSPRRSTGVGTPGKALRGTTMSWTAIPRRVRKKQHSKEPELRSPVPAPLIAEPHYVPGHPRLGNMTARQREAILAFERETGFDVLRLVPEGSTYVLPYFSPKPTREQLDSLPRFVRHRIARAITGELARKPHK